MPYKSFHSLLIVLFLLLTGCGRYVEPVPPEILAPEPVKDFSAVAAEDGVVFSFHSSEKDNRGKPLQTLEGYNIYRKQLTEEDMSIFKREGYSLVTTIQDSHLKPLQELQQQARESGKSPRKVVVPAKLTTFSYKDTGLTPASTYSYRVVGVNQGGVEAEIDRIVQVLYNGLTSEIVTIR